MHERARTAVVFSGGGTGGHLYPALALADALVALRPDVHPFFVGAQRGLEARVLPERGLDHCLLPVRGFPRGSGLAGLEALPALGASVLRMADLVRRLRPEAVVVTGGYAGAPAGIVAGVMGIPLALQEQNAVPGVTTRLLARWARQVHVAFPEALRHLPARARTRASVGGNPVRPVLALDRARARVELDLPGEGVVVLVQGGSQGSAALNRILLEAVSDAVASERSLIADLFLFWSTGPRHYEAVREALVSLGDPSWVRAVPYIDDMPKVLVAVDVAVSRSGAMSTAELVNHGIPAVLVPLPTAAADHQSHNAQALADAGAALVAEESGLTGAGLWHRLASLISDPELRARMAAAALERAHPDAATEIARALVTLLPGGAR